MVAQEEVCLILAEPRKTALNFFKNSGYGEFQMYIKVEIIVYIEPSYTYHPTSVIVDREPIVFLNCYELQFHSNSLRKKFLE